MSGSNRFCGVVSVAVFGLRSGVIRYVLFVFVGVV